MGGGGEDDDATTTTRRPALVVGTGRKGRRVTLISKAHSSVQNLGMGAQTADHWVQSGRCFLDWLVVEEVTQLDVGLWADIAGQAGAVPTARRLQAAARGAGRLRRGAGAPHAGVAAAPDLAGGFLHELTENQRSDQKSFPFLEWLRVGGGAGGAAGCSAAGAGVPEAWGRTRAW